MRGWRDHPVVARPRRERRGGFARLPGRRGRKGGMRGGCASPHPSTPYVLLFKKRFRVGTCSHPTAVCSGATTNRDRGNDTAPTHPPGKRSHGVEVPSKINPLRLYVLTIVTRARRPYTNVKISPRRGVWGNRVSPRPRPAGVWGNRVSPYPQSVGGFGRATSPQELFSSRRCAAEPHGRLKRIPDLIALKLPRAGAGVERGLLSFASVAYDDATVNCR